MQVACESYEVSFKHICEILFILVGVVAASQVISLLFLSLELVVQKTLYFVYQPLLVHRLLVEGQAHEDVFRVLLLKVLLEGIEICLGAE